MLGQGIKDHFFLLIIQLMLNVGMSVLLQLGKLSIYDHENNLVQGIKVNPKRFWKYVASQSKVKQAVGGLLKPDDSQTVDDIDTANTLNKFLVVCLHMKTLQTHLHLETCTWEIPLVPLQLQLRTFGISYVE